MKILKNLTISLALMTPVTAAADCPSTVVNNEIGQGLEASASGVPNYAQGSFPGKNDCGPTAAAMLMGYYDANGWPCMIPGSGPYYKSGTPPSAGLNALVDDLKSEMPYSESFGSPPSNGLDLNGKAVVKVAGWKDPGASWTYDEDEIVSTSDIMNHINTQHPLLLCVRAFGSDYVWIDDGSNSGETGSVDWHWMTVLGYEKVKEYADIAGSCIDWLDDDEFYVVMRSGWRRGGDSRIKYHFGFWDDLYTVEVWPGGNSTCVDPQDEDSDGQATTTPIPGMTGGTDCDDGDSTVGAGFPELCDSKDNDCDGEIDEGFADSDGDGIDDPCDMCPNDYDPAQLDSDHDGLGDACDPDDDNDGCDDADDDSPLSAYSEVGTMINPNCHPAQSPWVVFDGVDSDGDGLLNCEDADDDNDGIADVFDECPTGSCTIVGRVCPMLPIGPECLMGGCIFTLELLNSINPDPTQVTEFVNVQVVENILYLNRAGLTGAMEAFTLGRGESLRLTMQSGRDSYELGTFTTNDLSILDGAGSLLAIDIAGGVLNVEAMMTIR